MMNKILYVLFVLFCVMLLSGHVLAEEEYFISNPNMEEYLQRHPLKTTPRASSVMEAEKHLQIEAAQAVVDYVRKHGAEEAGAEINKGADGVFAEYYNIGPQFRIILWEYSQTGPDGKPGNFGAFLGHNLFLNMIGQPLDFDSFVGLSGWKFLLEYQRAQFSPAGKGWVTNIFWTDDLWANSEVVRYIAYNQRVDDTTHFAVTIVTALDE